MKNIFLKLYQQLLISFILASLLTYASIWLINQWRFSQHVEEISKGTISLIAKGLDRHEGKEQLEWLEAISRIINLKLLIHTKKNNSEDFYIESSLFEKRIKLNHRIGESDKFVSAEIMEVNEEIAYATAVLILNELGITEKENRLHHLEYLQNSFSFPIKKVNKNLLNLSDSQTRRLLYGDVFIKLDNQYENQRSINAFAPYGKTNSALVVGPIPLFTWYTQEIILIALALLLLFIGAIGIFIVRPVEKKFLVLIDSVDKVGLDHNPFFINLPGNDSLNLLADRINKMSERISTLINYQSELTHAISHDLKTPLARLRFRLSLLESAKDDHEKQERISGMSRDIDDLNTLSQGVLTLAQLQIGKNPLNINSINIEAFLNELTNDLELLDSKNLIKLSSHVSTLYADKDYLKRAILNLLTNSLRYVNKEILMSIDTKGSKTSIIVEDDGPGISPEARLKIFEPFATVDQTRNKKFGGTGLGLTITKKIVEWHQGEISVEDSALGGAKFIILIPSLVDKNTEFKNVEVINSQPNVN